jgi:phage-related protein
MSDVNVHIGATQDVDKAAAAASAALGNLKKAIDDSRQGVEKQNQTVGSSKISWAEFAAGAFAAYAALDKFTKFVRETVNIYAEHEQGIMSLTAILTTNTEATNNTINALMDYAQGMQEMTGIDDDVILKSMSLLAAQNMSEESMKRLTTAAIQLSRTGLVSFEMAMRGLTSSVEDGSIGMLGRYIPALKQFSEEQLKGGAAIEFVGSTFKNLLPALENTTQTIMDRTKQLWNDQKERIGEVFASVYQNIDKAKQTIQTIGDIGVTIATIIVKAGTVLLWLLKEQYVWFGGMLKLMVDLVVAVAKTLWAPFEWAFHGFAESIKLLFVNVINFLIDQVEWLIQQIGVGIQKLTGGKMGGAVANLELGGLTYKETPQEPLKDTFTNIWKEFAGQAGTVWDTFSKDFSELIASLTPPVRNLQDAISDVQTAASKLTVALESPSSNTPMPFLPGAIDYVQPGAVSGAGTPSAAVEEAFNPLIDIMSTLGTSMGQMGAAGNIAGTALMVLAGAAAPITLLLAILQPIIDAMLKVIAPVLTRIMQPLMGFLTILGQLLGAVIVPILDVLGPILKILAYGLVILYNVAIMPFANLVIFVFNLLYDFVALIWNAIAGAINFFLGWLGVNIPYMAAKALNEGMLSAIDMSTLEAAGVSADQNASSGGGYSSSTTVQHPPDINVYITVQGDVIAEDLGRRLVDAISAYLGTGARVAFLEAPQAGT